MAKIKKSNAGRKPLPPGEKLVPVTILVKEKHKSKALPACAAIAAKYRL